MKLNEWISKAKQVKLKIIDFQHADPDRIRDLILASAFAVAVTSLTLAYYFSSGLGFHQMYFKLVTF